MTVSAPGDHGDHDVVIVGGGLVGATLACALGTVGIRVCVIEATPLQSAEQPSYDDRAIAVSLGSQRILDGLGVWDGVSYRATPIHRIHVSDAGRFGFTRIAAADHGVEALGYVAHARVLGEALGAHLNACESVQVFCPAEVLGVAVDDAGVTVRFADGDRVASSVARLLVAADGGRSAIRDLLGVAADERDYEQVAITANVSPRRSHQNVAYERFTEEGPLALLPLSEGRCGLIWSVDAGSAGDLVEANDEDFLQALGARFGSRLGRFLRVGARQHYDLSFIRSRTQMVPRCVFAGNAAHTLHPVAGQGFNLSLRDVATLAEIVVDAMGRGADPGEMDVLRRYGDWRRQDQHRVASFTDGLVRLFSNRFAPLAFGRNLGLLAMDFAPPLKDALARRAMGLAGRQPRLARGLAL